MSDDTQNTHGGARRGAGRPAGGKNARPTRAAQYEQQFLTRLTPERFLETIDELLRIALHGVNETNRLKAIQMIHDRAMGKPTETLEIDTAGEKLTAEDIVSTWRRQNR